MEVLGDGLAKQGLHLIHRQTRNPVRQTSGLTALQTTGRDLVKPTEIAVHVESESVLGDPAATTNANRRHLATLQPQAGQARLPFSLQAKLRQHIDQQLLQLPQIHVQIGGAALQIQHWIHHDLTRQMVGHLPTPIDVVQRVRRLGDIKMKMLQAGTTAKGVTRRMLENPDSFRSLAVGHQTFLPATLISPGEIKGTGSCGWKQIAPPGCADAPTGPSLLLTTGKEQGMKLLIHGRNLEITPALRTYTQTKLERAVHHFGDVVREADVHLSVARNPRVPQQTAEVTVFANGTVIRAQERSENLYASIDLAAGKLCRQLRRWKDRHSDHHHSHGHRASVTPGTEDVSAESQVDNSLLEGREAELPNPGVRRKYFAMPPMSLDEARRQLDVIDHDFYLFRERDSDELQVIYRRNHGGYGVIQART